MEFVQPSFRNQVLVIPRRKTIDLNQIDVDYGTSCLGNYLKDETATLKRYPTSIDKGMEVIPSETGFKKSNPKCIVTNSSDYMTYRYYGFDEKDVYFCSFVWHDDTKRVRMFGTTPHSLCSHNSNKISYDKSYVLRQQVDNNKSSCGGFDKITIDDSKTNERQYIAVELTAPITGLEYKITLPGLMACIAHNVNNLYGLRNLTTCLGNLCETSGFLLGDFLSNEYMNINSERGTIFFNLVRDKFLKSGDVHIPQYPKWFDRFIASAITVKDLLKSNTSYNINNHNLFNFKSTTVADPQQQRCSQTTHAHNHSRTPIQRTTYSSSSSSSRVPSNNMPPISSTPAPPPLFPSQAMSTPVPISTVNDDCTASVSIVGKDGAIIKDRMIHISTKDGNPRKLSELLKDPCLKYTVGSRFRHVCRMIDGNHPHGCGRSFTDAGTINEHIVTVHITPSIPTKCTWLNCHKLKTWEDPVTLAGHIKRMHVEKSIWPQSKCIIPLQVDTAYAELVGEPTLFNDPSNHDSFIGSDGAPIPKINTVTSLSGKVAPQQHESHSVDQQVFDQTNNSGSGHLFASNVAAFQDQMILQQLQQHQPSMSSVSNISNSIFQLQAIGDNSSSLGSTTVNNNILLGHGHGHGHPPRVTIPFRGGETNQNNVSIPVAAGGGAGARAGAAASRNDYASNMHLSYLTNNGLGGGLNYTQVPNFLPQPPNQQPNYPFNNIRVMEQHSGGGGGGLQQDNIAAAAAAGNDYVRFSKEYILYKNGEISKQRHQKEAVSTLHLPRDKKALLDRAVENGEELIKEHESDNDVDVIDVSDCELHSKELFATNNNSSGMRNNRTVGSSPAVSQSINTSKSVIVLQTLEKLARQLAMSA